MILVDDTTAIATPAAFDDLREYSASLPTGKTIGKRWKRARNTYNGDDGWLLGEYAPDPDPQYVRILWRELLVVP